MTCTHDVLDQRGRCIDCGEWAVLTGQVPVTQSEITEDERCYEDACRLPFGHEGLHKPWSARD